MSNWPMQPYMQEQKECPGLAGSDNIALKQECKFRKCISRLRLTERYFTLDECMYCGARRNIREVTREMSEGERAKLPWAKPLKKS